MTKQHARDLEAGGAVASSADRVLSVLGLFEEAHPVWSVEQAAPRLGVSVSTGYRYFASLCQAGLLDPVSGSGYRLGPAIIEYDRQIRRCDPMLGAARAHMDRLRSGVGRDAAIILCRLFRDQVMCIAEVSESAQPVRLAYERGRPMSMFRGATSKIILAFLPRRVLRRLYESHRDEVEAGGLGADWVAFKSRLKRLRRQGYCVTEAELDVGRLGIAAPVFGRGDAVVGSLSIVGRLAEVNERVRMEWQLLLSEAAAGTSASLADLDESSAPSVPRAVA